MAGAKAARAGTKAQSKPWISDGSGSLASSPRIVSEELMALLRRGNASAVKRWLKSGVDVNQVLHAPQLDKPWGYTTPPAAAATAANPAATPAADDGGAAAVGGSIPSSANAASAPAPASSFGHWPLILLACAVSSAGVVEVLLKAGADPNVHNQYGLTALVAAVHNDGLSATEKLVLAKLLNRHGFSLYGASCEALGERATAATALLHQLAVGEAEAREAAGPLLDWLLQHEPLPPPSDPQLFQHLCFCLALEPAALQLWLPLLQRRPPYVPGTPGYAELVVGVVAAAHQLKDARAAAAAQAMGAAPPPGPAAAPLSAAATGSHFLEGFADGGIVEEELGASAPGGGGSAVRPASAVMTHREGSLLAARKRERSRQGARARVAARAAAASASAASVASATAGAAAAPSGDWDAAGALRGVGPGEEVLVLRAFLECGLNPNVPMCTDGLLPMQRFLEKPELLSVLLEGGMDPRIRAGVAPLDLTFLHSYALIGRFQSSSEASVQACALLLSADPGLLWLRCAGLTAFELALAHVNLALVEYLAPLMGPEQQEAAAMLRQRMLGGPTGRPAKCLSCTARLGGAEEGGGEEGGGTSAAAAGGGGADVDVDVEEDVAARVWDPASPAAAAAAVAAAAAASPVTVPGQDSEVASSYRLLCLALQRPELWGNNMTGLMRQVPLMDIRQILTLLDVLNSPNLFNIVAFMEHCRTFAQRVILQVLQLGAEGHEAMQAAVPPAAVEVALAFLRAYPENIWLQSVAKYFPPLVDSMVAREDTRDFMLVAPQKLLDRAEEISQLPPDLVQAACESARAAMLLENGFHCPRPQLDDLEGPLRRFADVGYHRLLLRLLLRLPAASKQLCNNPALTAVVAEALAVVQACMSGRPAAAAKRGVAAEAAEAGDDPAASATGASYLEAVDAAVAHLAAHLGGMGAANAAAAVPPPSAAAADGAELAAAAAAAAAVSSAADTSEPSATVPGAEPSLPGPATSLSSPSPPATAATLPPPDCSGGFPPELSYLEEVVVEQTELLQSLYALMALCSLCSHLLCPEFGLAIGQLSLDQLYAQLLGNMGPAGPEQRELVESRREFLKQVLAMDSMWRAMRQADQQQQQHQQEEEEEEEEEEEGQGEGKALGEEEAENTQAEGGAVAVAAAAATGPAAAPPLDEQRGAAATEVTADLTEVTGEAAPLPPRRALRNPALVEAAREAVLSHPVIWSAVRAVAALPAAPGPHPGVRVLWDDDNTPIYVLMSLASRRAVEAAARTPAPPTSSHRLGTQHRQRVCFGAVSHHHATFLRPSDGSAGCHYTTCVFGCLGHLLHCKEPSCGGQGRRQGLSPLQAAANIRRPKQPRCEVTERPSMEGVQLVAAGDLCVNTLMQIHIDLKQMLGYHLCWIRFVRASTGPANLDLPV
ncbi:hypothetical protein VOLCADRAFT_104435 [Volvox carteri f. nagariensis]|uniref:Uncharacterized protein n=1 Tax=Volvox carteri f. nagariensis TaxID=3068 RepID=D8TTL4_VOLCA|nr:uncharacterized protein VOLCADRAFT_104435 [Volvox carteri f. nagariensis]EFJ49219.1 hypothetical protein VOLCADRAFT_104435 [Volvox carteri f. nagariensis]|eukprot:XP_002949667.1 hypothetical protein VOLCADRAFT_104435 [Volvox carteri f. nagariensis]